MHSRILIIAGILLVVTLGSLYFSSDDAPLIKAGEQASWKSFDEGVTVAQREKKKILVDVYTDWCTWCKKMDAETYTDDGVRHLLDKSFVTIKLNAESDRLVTFQGKTMTEAQFAQEAGVTGYPATLFLDENLKPITLVPGYLQADRFTQILKFIGENHYRSMTFDAYTSKQAG